MTEPKINKFDDKHASNNEPSNNSRPLQGAFAAGFFALFWSLVAGGFSTVFVNMFFNPTIDFSSSPHINCIFVASIIIGIYCGYIWKTDLNSCINSLTRKGALLGVVAGAIVAIALGIANIG